MDTKIIFSPTKEDIKEAAAVLRNGGTVAFPTETVYGLGGNALDGNAASKIYKAKGRPSDNPLIIHLSSMEEAEEYCHTSPLYYQLAFHFMPGPLTVIMKKKDCIPETVTGGLDTVAVRVPSHAVAHLLIKEFGLPVAAPSANISGRPSPTTVEHVIEDLNGKVDMILNGGPCEIGLESTIVKIDGDELTLLRPGAITPEMLKDAGFETVIAPGLNGALKENEHPLAPGMKYRHYAPIAKVILLDGKEEDVLSYMQEKAHKDFVGILCSDVVKDKIQGKYVFSYGETSTEESKHLFALLRLFDQSEEVQEIYAALPSKDGIGLAVYNRLAKAAGFHIVHL